jgi:magnesium transporter
MPEPPRPPLPPPNPALDPALDAALDPPLDPPGKPAAAPAADALASGALAAGTTCSYFRDPDGHLWTNLRAADLPTAVRQCGRGSAPGDVEAPAGGLLWVDVDSRDPAQHALLRDVFRFHPLAVEDTLSAESRVRVEQYEDAYLFAIVRAVGFQESTPDPYDLRTQNLYFFLGRHYLVTVHDGPAPAVGRVRAHVDRNPALMARGVARVAHLVMDDAVDAYFPVLHGIDEFFDAIEPRVFEAFDERALQDIFQLKRLVLTLRRYLAPQREVFNVLANRPTDLIPHETQRYFADVHDHVLRVYDGLDAARDLLGSTLDSYLTQVSNRTGNASKSLAVVATLSTPFVVVAGMWGMNFERVPLSHHPHGFWLMLALQLALGAALLAVLRWRKLI